MNNIFLIGRITKDIDLRTSASGKPLCLFSLAVNRQRHIDGESSADFFDCVAFGKTAENMSAYLGKGSKIALTGRIQFDTFQRQDGSTGRSATVLVNQVEFLDSRNTTYTQGQQAPQRQSSQPSYQSYEPDITNEDLPF
jgi:single-strand DNA-binding protein